MKNSITTIAIVVLALAFWKVAVPIAVGWVLWVGIDVASPKAAPYFKKWFSKSETAISDSKLADVK